MAMNVRRIVTGHNAAGKAVIKTDEQIAAVPRIGAGITGAEIWSTDQMPIDNSAAADAAQRAGFVKQTNYVGDGGGTTFRINEFAPGCVRFTHAPSALFVKILSAIARRATAEAFSLPSPCGRLRECRIRPGGWQNEGG